MRPNPTTPACKFRSADPEAQQAYQPRELACECTQAHVHILFQINPSPARTLTIQSHVTILLSKERSPKSRTGRPLGAVVVQYLRVLRPSEKNITFFLVNLSKILSNLQKNRTIYGTN